MAPHPKNMYPCVECRRHSYRCEFPSQASICIRCAEKKVECSGPSVQHRNLPCKRCRYRKQACHRRLGAAKCDACLQSGSVCQQSIILRDASGQRAILSPASQNLSHLSLSYALTYHLIELYVELTGGGQTSFGGFHHIEVKVAHCRGKLNELDDKDELMALMCMNEVLRLSNHSSIRRTSSRIGQQERISGGYLIRDAVLASERNIQRRVEHLLKLELARESTFDATLATLFRLSLGTIRVSANLVFTRQAVEPMLTLAVQRRLVDVLKSQGSDRAVVAFFGTMMTEYFSHEVRQGPLSQYLRERWVANNSAAIKAEESFLPLDFQQIDQFFTHGSFPHPERLWSSQYAELRRAVAFPELGVHATAPPAQVRNSEFREVILKAKNMTEITVSRITSHRDFQEAMSKRATDGSPHNFLDVVVRNVTLFSKACSEHWEFRKTFATRSACPDTCADELKQWLTNFVEWSSMLFDYRDRFTIWHQHEMIDQRWLEFLLKLFDTPGSSELATQWISQNADVAVKRLLPILEWASSARYEASDLAYFVKNTISLQSPSSSSVTIVEATLSELSGSEGSESPRSGGSSASQAGRIVTHALNEL